MDIDEKWIYVERVLEFLQELHGKVSLAAHDVMLEPESPLIQPFFAVAGELAKAMAIIVDDKGEWIDWYVNECDFGRCPKEAGCEGNMQIIDDLEKLRQVIELDCET